MFFVWTYTGTRRPLTEKREPCMCVCLCLSPEVAVKNNLAEKLKCFSVIKVWRFLVMPADCCLEIGVCCCNFACGLAAIPDRAT